MPSGLHSLPHAKRDSLCPEPQFVRHAKPPKLANLCWRGERSHSLSDMVPTRRSWLGSVARKNKIGRRHLAERQEALSVSLKVALRSALLLALQEGHS